MLSFLELRTCQKERVIMFPTFQLNSDNNLASDLQPVLKAFDRQPLSEPEQGFLISYQINYNDLTVGNELGQGGFGIVYKGTYQFAPVAIKQLQIGNLSPAAQEEFRKEAEMMAQLRHPNIVHFYGYCSIPKCLVMEYMPKGSLFNVLQDKKQILDWNVRIGIAVDMVSGLAFLHSKNILHRDIKSLNVLLDEQAKARLTDFGLSKVKNETKSLTKNAQKNKELVGTLPWIAPELFDGEKYTYKSDIYSLGITFWELATRQIPYAEHTSEAIPVFVSRGKREIIPQDCPPKLAYLIQECWAGNPDARPTAEDLAKFMTTDAKTLQEVSHSPAVKIKITTFSPAVAFGLQANPAASPALLNNAVKRRESVKFNFAGKKDEQEKMRYVLEELRTFFIEEREEGERTENYAIYNGYLKKASDGVQLVYKVKQNKHILYVNDEPVDASTAAKELSKMLKSLAAANVPAKLAASPTVQSLSAINVNPTQAAPQVFSPAVAPVLKVNLPAQEIPPRMLTQFEGTAKPVPRINTSDFKDVREILRLVAEGEQDKAESMLKSNPALALVPGEVTDLSKRTFTNITIFQYACWALDWHMWTMIRKYLPDNEAKQQAEGFETESWVEKHGVHAQWILDKLIEAYQITIDLYNAKKHTEGDIAWIQQVGGAQSLLPAHVVNEYCHPTRAFYPLPDFRDATPLPRTRSIGHGEWFTAKGGIGATFAVYRGKGEAWGRGLGGRVVNRKNVASGVLAWFGWYGESSDRASISALSYIRTVQREELINELKPRPVQKKVA